MPDSLPRRSPRIRRGSIVRFAGWLVIGLIAAAGRSPAPSRAVELTAEPPTGRWTTFASGDDILDLVLDGDTVWAGTRAGGLVRWRGLSGEGPKVRQFLRPQDPIGGNTVNSLAVDASGRVWMATDGGLSVLDDRGTEATEDDRWQTWTVESSFGGLPSDDLRAVAVGADGETIWVGGAQQQDPETGDWSGGGVGRLFTQGSFEASDDSWAPLISFASSYREQPDGSVTLGLVSDTITGIAIAPGGHVWVSTAPHWRRLRGADPEAPPFWQQVHGGLSHVDTRGTPDPSDDRWFGTSCETTQLTVTCNVQTVAIDPAGRGWAAIGGRGVIHFDPTLDFVPPAVTGIRLSPPPGEGDPFVLDIAFGPAGDPELGNTVWLGSRGGGLSVLDHHGAYASPNRHTWNFDRGGPFAAADGLESQRVQAIAIGAGRVFIGSGPEQGLAAGIRPLELAGLSLEPAWRTPGGPASNFVTDIAAGPAGGPWAGQVWIATGSRAPSIAMRHSGAGLSRLVGGGSADPSDDQWTHFDSRNTDDDGRMPWTGISGDNVQAIAFSGDQAWVGSMSAIWDREAGRYLDGGLARFDGLEWSNRKASEAGGLPSGNISSLAAGCDDSLWIGTGEPWEHVGHGVLVLRSGADPSDPSQDRWTRYAYPELASDNVTALGADCSRGRIWVAGTHHSRREGGGAAWVGGGAAAFDLATARWTRFDARGDLVSFQEGAITGEIMALTTGELGRAWLGGYGTRETTAGSLIARRPFWPATLNVLDGESWSHSLFEHAGWVSTLTLDDQDRLWVGTSRGGAARDSVAPESWRSDRDAGGLYLATGPAWARLDLRNSGLPANDISVVRSAPDGTLWIGTEGWGLARFEPGAESATATPASGAASPTPSPTSVEPTPTPPRGSATRTPTSVRTATAGTSGPIRLHLPRLAKQR
ncbi:MAG: hypothetical protein KDH92_11185 [Chloroflexi bacterium]|nr:hypothetical protein [Chloroflexota bacterium]